MQKFTTIKQLYTFKKMILVAVTEVCEKLNKLGD